MELDEIKDLNEADKILFLKGAKYGAIRVLTHLNSMVAETLADAVDTDIKDYL